MAAALLAASGLALAENYVGTDRAEKIVGTKHADHINAMGGGDVVQGWAGADKIRGGNDNDKQYGDRGNDVIYTEGGYRDLVNCGKGIDTAYVDSKDRVVGCEKQIRIEPALGCDLLASQERYQNVRDDGRNQQAIVGSALMNEMLSKNSKFSQSSVPVVAYDVADGLVVGYPIGFDHEEA